MKKPVKDVTFNFFNYKWSQVPQWAKKTEAVYRQWYLKRYGYGTAEGFKKFLKDKYTLAEAGCGGARDSKFFAELAPHASVLAVDQSAQALAAASKTLADIPNCSTKRMDITKFKHTHGFDFISCDQVLHHTPDPSLTMRKLYENLNPGGVFNFSVCRKKNAYRDLVDDLIMDKAQSMDPKKLWQFAEVVTQFGKALHDIGINKVKFGKKKYDNLQRFVHDNVFRCWYRPEIDTRLSVSSNYDWFSGNPRFSKDELMSMMRRGLGKTNYKLLRLFEDDATISVSVSKPAEKRR